MNENSKKTTYCVIEEVKKRVDYTAKARAISIRTTLPEVDDEVLWDESMIIHALCNIVENSINYSSDGCIVDIKCKLSNNDVYIEIIDRGVGIDKSDISSIFIKFWRKNDDIVEGTGIGLTFSKAVVDGHDGEIKVSSELGKGSCFSIRLPRKVGAKNG